MKEIDRYAILKEQKTAVWPPKLSISPQAGMLATAIGFRELGQFGQDLWLLPGLYSAVSKEAALLAAAQSLTCISLLKQKRQRIRAAAN